MFENDAGEERTGAVVTLDVEALALSPEARGLLASFTSAAAALSTEADIALTDRRKRKGGGVA